MLKKQKSIEATIKDIFKFVLIVFVSSAYYVFFSDYIRTNGEEWYLNILNTFLFLYAFSRISKLIKNIRLFSDEGGMQLKSIYEVFLIYFLTIISCSYNLEKIKEILKIYQINNIFITENLTAYTIISYFYRSLSIIKTAIEIAIVKDVVFQLNGWNLNKTIREYWDELLKNHKIYILHDDQNKKVPRLWIIRGGACVDIIDDIEKCKIYKSHEEYIKLTDTQAKEILRRRKSKGFDDDDCIYEGDSTWIFTPWKSEHFYEVSLYLIDVSYCDEEIIKELINKNRGMLQILPSDVKSYRKSNHKIKNKRYKL